MSGDAGREASGCARFLPAALVLLPLPDLLLCCWSAKTRRLACRHPGTLHQPFSGMFPSKLPRTGRCTQRMDNHDLAGVAACC